MLRQSLTHVVQKPPWRIHVPGTGRTIEMGDIVHSVLGAMVMVMVSLPLLLFFNPTVLLFFAPVGVLCGLLVRRWTPGDIGWRNYISAAVRYHICRKKSRKACGGSKEHRGVKYINLWAPPPLFADMTSGERSVWMPQHIAVGENYELRPEQQV